jgi:hypothetical protein
MTFRDFKISFLIKISANFGIQIGSFEVFSKKLAKISEKYLQFGLKWCIIKMQDKG